MAPSSLGYLGAILVATSYAAPIVPDASLARRGQCKDENGYIVGTRLDCSQLTPAIILPPAGYVYRRDESAAEDRNVKADNFDDDGVLVDRRDEITHLPASSIYIAKVPHESTHDGGSGSGNLPSSSQGDKTSGVGQGHPWVTVPEPNAIGVPKFTLPVEKPTSMIRRRANAERGYGADLVVHHPANEIWRRDDEPRDGKDPHKTKQTLPGLNSHTLEPEKSEVEQLFQQSKSAGQDDPIEAKLTIMRLAQDLYRRGGPEPVSPGGGKFRKSVDAQHLSGYQASGGDDMGPVNMAHLTTLYPAEGVYRRSQSVEATGQNVESTSQTGSEDTAAVKDLTAALNDESQLKAARRGAENVESMSQNMESLGQIIAGQNRVEDTAAVENIINALNSIRHPEPSKRSILPPQDPDFPKHRPGLGYILPMLSERDPGGRTIFNEIKDKLDKLKPTAPGGDSSSGDSGKGGDSASGGDTAHSGSGKADSKAGAKRRSQTEELDIESEGRSEDGKTAQPDVLPSSPEFEAGSLKHPVLDQTKSVHRRNALSIDDVLPDFPTPSAHERTGSVFKRSVDIEASERVSKPVAKPKPESAAPPPIPFDREDVNPPKYRIIAPADSVFRSHGARKRSAVPDDDSTLLDPEEALVMHGPATNIYRRDDGSDSAEEEKQRDEHLSKRCYGQFLGMELCELISAPYVYRAGTGDEKVKDEQKQKQKNEEEKENQRRDPIPIPDTNMVIDPSLPSPPSRIDARKRCYTHNSDAQYCQLRTAPEVYWEVGKGGVRE